MTYTDFGKKGQQTRSWFSPRFFALVLVAFLFGGAIAHNRLDLALWAHKWKLDPVSFTSHQDFLENGIRVLYPEDASKPVGAVLQFHGCAGIRDSHFTSWGDIALRAGYAVVWVDSLAPRNISNDEARAQVCTGKRLLGFERTADVAAALNIIKRDPRIDSSNIVLAGWSHGAWSVMDFLTMDLKKRRPPTLPQINEELPKIRKLFLMYPYCGFGTLSRKRAWHQYPQTLTINVGKDEMVDGYDCDRFFAKLASNGAPISKHFFPDAHHAFDDPHLPEDYQHWHHPARTEQARSLYLKFLVENEN